MGCRVTKVWRISKAAYAADCLQGSGSRLYPGRWNKRGQAVCYTSNTLSLAVLEILVHVDPEDWPEDMVAIAIDIPDDLKVVNVEEQLATGRTVKALDMLTCQRIGSDWLDQGNSALLSVPSVVVPQERNLIIASEHPDTAQIKVSYVEPFSLDKRLQRSEQL
jgi:RES domain-containing protein